MKLSEFIKKTTSSLSEIYPEKEARNIISIYLESRLGLSSWQQVIKGEEDVDESAFASDVDRLLEGEPLQYVLGEARFYGRTFKVSPAVLIPRPETELLVEKALGLLPSSSARVLDLCTGSGAIAWSLALERPQWIVDAVDISSEALKVAESQFDGQAVCNRPRFIEGDVLDPEFLRTLGRYDMIVSNPPYIKESEKAFMRKNVLDYEPSLALFVPDEDPLVFYRAIARGVADLLCETGGGIVECNDILCSQTTAVFAREGIEGVEEAADLAGKKRFVSFRR